MSTDDENLYVSGKDLGRRRRAEKRNDRKEELPIATDFLSLSLSLPLFLSSNVCVTCSRSRTNSVPRKKKDGDDDVSVSNDDVRHTIWRRRPGVEYDDCTTCFDPLQMDYVDFY